MTVKILVTSLGQHIIADAKQVENKETQELVGYWMDNPRLVGYNRQEDTNDIGIQFMPYCLVSDESSFTVRADHVVAILEPREDVREKYENIVHPPEDDIPQNVEVITDESSDNAPEDGGETDNGDGAA